MYSINFCFWFVWYFVLCRISIKISTPARKWRKFFVLFAAISFNQWKKNRRHGKMFSLDTIQCLITIFVVAAGIVLFLLVEKLVRYVEENSGGSSAWSHGHHHHHHKTNKKLKDDNDSHDDLQSESSSGKDRRKLKMSSEEEAAAEVSNDSLMESNQHDSHIRKVS